jgi:hypothetical protein
MVFANLANGARLLALLPHLLDEANLGPDRQAIEGIVKNAVAMEIDLAAVGGLDKFIIVTGHELRHAAVVLHFMRLDLTPGSSRHANLLKAFLVPGTLVEQA